MFLALLVLYVIVCLALIFIILIQTGKGGLDSNFGGVATNMLGTQGANDFIKKWTKVLFAAFVILCILLAMQVKRDRGGSANVGEGSSVVGDAAQAERDSMDDGTQTEQQRRSPETQPEEE